MKKGLCFGDMLIKLNNRQTIGASRSREFDSAAKNCDRTIKALQLTEDIHNELIEAVQRLIEQAENDAFSAGAQSAKLIGRR